MALTETKTEKVPGRITHVYVGYDATHGVDISNGIKSFDYARIHDARRSFVANTKTAASDLQPHSHYRWTLEFLSDCRTAFFATDVQVAGGDQFAMLPSGDSNVIEYFRVIVPIIDADGATKTRTYTITNGYALRNRAYIGDDKDAIFVYEGDAEAITYADA